jgi:transcriptional regulator with XRE-family HTH domain
MKRINKEFTSPLLLDTAARLGAAIKLARVARDITQIDCAERAHLSTRSLARIEKGDVSVSLSGWLQALNQVGLMALLEVPATPEKDLVGEIRRNKELRSRASKRLGETYEF